MEIHKILKDRGSRYGKFEQHARITQSMKDAMRLESMGTYTELPDYIKEALEMICHKIGRIINGDPYYLDSYMDIIGYTQLAIEQIKASDATLND